MPDRVLYNFHVRYVRNTETPRFRSHGRRCFFSKEQVGTARGTGRATDLRPRLISLISTRNPDSPEIHHMLKNQTHAQKQRQIEGICLLGWKATCRQVAPAPTTTMSMRLHMANERLPHRSRFLSQNFGALN